MIIETKLKYRNINTRLNKDLICTELIKNNIQCEFFPLIVRGVVGTYGFEDGSYGFEDGAYGFYTGEKVYD